MFSLPNILSSCLEPLSSVVDTALVGQMSTPWLAGMGVGATLVNAFSWGFNFLVHTSTQSVSEALAQKKISLARSKIKVALGLSLFLGICSILIIFPWRFELYNLAGASEAIKFHADDYFAVRLLGQPFFLLFVTMLSILRGMEEVKKCFYLIFLTTGLNILLSWWALYHLEMGVRGVALASVLAHVVGAIGAMLILVSHREVAAGLFKGPVHLDSLFSYGKNALNLFGRSFFITGMFFISTKLAGEMGTLQIAAHQILLQLWLFSSFFIDGIAITGNCLTPKFFFGAQWNQLLEFFKNLGRLAGGIGFAFSLFYFFGQNLILERFTNDPQLLELGQQLWPLMALVQFPMAICYHYDGLMFGLGEFAFLRNMVALAVLFVFLPLVYLAWQYESLLLLWLGVVGVGFFRLFSSHIKLRQVIGKVHWEMAQKGA